MQKSHKLLNLFSLLLLLLLLLFLLLLSPLSHSHTFLEKVPVTLSTVLCNGYPPAMLSRGSTADLFLVEEGNRLIYYHLDNEGEIQRAREIGELSFTPSYLGVERTSTHYFVYMVSAAPPSEREWKIMILSEDLQKLSSFGRRAPFLEPRDIDLLHIDGLLHLFTVEEKEPKLYWRRFNDSGEEVSEKRCISEHLHLGVPRGVKGEDDTFYLTWRRSQRYNGILSFAIFKEEEIIKEGDLGEFPYLYIIGLSTRELVEEVGPSLVSREGGGFWVAWTHAYYEGFREYSTIMVLEVSGEGERLKSYTIEGEEQFALFPSLFKDNEGRLHLAWEEMVGGGFDIYYTLLDAEGSPRERVTWSYSHNRLVRGLSLGEDIAFTGRTHTQEGDSIWFITSSFTPELGYRNFGIFGTTLGEQLGEIFLSLVSLVMPLLLYIGSKWPLLIILFLLLLLLRWQGFLDQVPAQVLLPGILGVMLFFGHLLSNHSLVLSLRSQGTSLEAYSQILSTLLLLFYSSTFRREVLDEVTYLGLGLLWLLLAGVIHYFWQAGFVLTP